MCLLCNFSPASILKLFGNIVVYYDVDDDDYAIQLFFFL